MKISLNWLREYIKKGLEDIKDDELAEILTSTGLEVSTIEHFDFINPDLIIGEIKEVSQHPNADKLKLTKVDIGHKELKNIICGAPNVKKNQKVIVAPINTQLKLFDGSIIKIKKSKIRGEISEGMLCAEDEIGISDNHNYIIELDTNLKNGEKAYKYYNIYPDTVYEIDITPNRSDALSHIGVARDICAKLDTKIDISKYNLTNKLCGIKNYKDLKIIVKDQKSCLRYTGVLISNVEIKQSPIWLKAKLKSIGLNPINNVVDLTNYVMHEIGQPLHAYDYDKIYHKEIFISKNKKYTEFITLNDKKIKINSEDIMIYDAQKPLCLAGIMGSKQSSIDENTKNIFLESAIFDSVSILRSSKKYNISTDSSFRFERHVDPEYTKKALIRTTDLILNYTNGKISSEIFDFYPNPIQKKKIIISITHIQNILGTPIKYSQIISILKRLDFNIKKIDEDILEILAPTNRYDVERPADVIEEIIRIYGYDKISINENVTKVFFSKPSDDYKKYKSKNQIRKILTINKFQEIITNSLSKLQYYKKDDESIIHLKNPLSENLNILRRELIFSGLEVISYNIKRRKSDLCFFEIGKKYFHLQNEYIENEVLAIWMTEERITDYINNKNRNFIDLYSIVVQIFNTLNINYQTKHNRTKNQIEIFHEDLQTKIAHIKLLKNELVSKFEINQNIFYAEIDLDLFLNIEIDTPVYSKISKFPEVNRDLSLIVDPDIEFMQVENILNQPRNEILKSYLLKDLYFDKKSNKKTFTLSFIFQHPKKTLKEKDMNLVMNKLMDSFENKLNAKIKGRIKN